MLVPLIIKTDYSLLKSLITVKTLVNYLVTNNINSCAITDNNLSGCIEFYNLCKENNIKPIIGMEVTINNKIVYLYAKDYIGYQNLLKINTIVLNRELTMADLTKYNSKLICLIPFINNDVYSDLRSIFNDTFISYSSEYEKNNALVITSNIVYALELLAFNKEDTTYLKYLHAIESGSIESISYEKNYFLKTDEYDEETTIKFSELCNLEIPKNNKYIPIYDKSKDSYKYLMALSKRGLEKRLKGTIPANYLERLKYELKTISDMGYVDYFLIVYDYVKYAKSNNILVGPGRGSGAGSLVCYSIGITDIDPLEYDLLFERFLNPERITMPDIDIDFEYTKREEIVDYIRNKYGANYVAPIMTYGTLKSKQVLRDVAKICDLDEGITDELVSMVDARVPLSNNLKNKELFNYVDNNPKIKKIYKISLKLENLKRHQSTHAAGVVISSTPLDDVIPISKSADIILTGITMEYLEDLGLLKMDILALKNLTIIANVLKLMNNKLDINNIPLNDENVFELFCQGNTKGIFQFESVGMTNFLRKLCPTSFNDLIAAIALFRPGPMANIELFIKRKEGKFKVTYPHPSLESILSSTYGVIVYQEQIMQILVTMGGYSYAQADNIRRAMSKKKKEVMEKEKQTFINQCIAKGYKKEEASSVYDLILKFADYGFNKAHSVAYALIGYQMAYLKSKYPLYFLANLLNMSIGSEIKTKEYIREALKEGIKVLKPDINSSTNEYKIVDNSLLMPILAIKNTGSGAVNTILEEREKGEFRDFYDFVRRVYGKSVTKKTIESLIDASALDIFGINKQTLHKNIDNAITYGELSSGLEEMFVLKPQLEEYREYSEGELRKLEVNVLGFNLSNHPALKYNDKSIMKLSRIKEYFDKNVKCVVIIEEIKAIKTKNNEEMAFIRASDETSEADFVIFPKKNNLITNLHINDLVTIYGLVSKRLDKYQIVISNVEVKGEDK